MTAALERPLLPQEVIDRLNASARDIAAAFDRIGRQLGIMLDRWQRTFIAGGFLAKLRAELAADAARRERAAAAYRRRVARPSATRTTSPAFRAGTRRTKRLAAGGRSH